ncbi:MAG: cell division protein ZipA C-terminal FtsZ-binding domain-containing protein [Candidatus Berkiella sp.]
MRLMLLIIGMVLGSFLLFTSFTRKKQKKNEALHDEFEQTILENSQNLQIKRVEHMQQAHDAKYSYERENHSSFERPTADPLLEELKKPSIKGNFKMDDDDEEEEISGFDEAQKIQKPKEKAKSHGYLALTIMPKAGAQFSSIALQATLSRNHFRYGAQKLYHRHLQDNATQPVLYSVASIAKPGYFEQNNTQSYPGILIYLLLDEVQDPVSAFEKMLTTARQLSASLQAELCDATRQPITTSLISQYRDQAKAAINEPELEEEFQEW